MESVTLKLIGHARWKGLTGVILISHARFHLVESVTYVKWIGHARFHLVESVTVNVSVTSG